MKEIITSTMNAVETSLKETWDASNEHAAKLLQSALAVDPEAERLWTAHGNRKIKATRPTKEGVTQQPIRKAKVGPLTIPKTARRVTFKGSVNGNGKVCDR